MSSDDRDSIEAGPLGRVTTRLPSEASGEAPFSAQVELLGLFLAARPAIVERIEAVLNAQRRPAQYLKDRALLSRALEDAFHTLATLSDEQRRLKGRLEAAHWASGFRPHRVPGLHNDLIDPTELMMRAFYLWQQTRWPGRNGRVRFAETLFNLYVLRCLVLLSMRIWDAGSERAGDRLAQVQALLDALRTCSPPDQPVFVRDARWLIPLGQSPTTEDLGAYLEVAQRIAEMPAAADRLEIQLAHVRVVGGHLCSQIRHYCLSDGSSIDAPGVLRRTRSSNALDFALLVQGLVPLLEAYERALGGGDAGRRLVLAGAICQGISPDPELFVNRVELLGPYSMIEQSFVTQDRDGCIVHTPMGRRHLSLLERYGELIDRLAERLLEDCPRLRPIEGGCSPFGVIFGTPTNLIEDIALKSLEREAVTGFSLEDVFVDGDAGADRLAWVSGWRKLPHVDRAVQALYDYPHAFAVEIFARIEQVLGRHGAAGAASGGDRTGRLFVQSGDDPEAEAAAAQIPELPARYFRSSDRRLVTAERAVFREQAELLHDRQEGHFAVSYETAGGWTAVTKDFLTEVLGKGQDAKLGDLPPAAAGVLERMCPGLVLPAGSASGRQGAARGFERR